MKIRTLFNEYVWDQIKDNVENGFYPAFTQIYIPMMYFDNNYTTERKADRDKLMKYINTVFRDKLKSKSTMNNGKDDMGEALLPASVEYDSSMDKFFWLDIDHNRSSFKF